MEIVSQCGFHLFKLKEIEKSFSVLSLSLAFHIVQQIFFNIDTHLPKQNNRSEVVSFQVKILEFIIQMFTHIVNQHFSVRRDENHY